MTSSVAPFSLTICCAVVEVVACVASVAVDRALSLLVTCTAVVNDNIRNPAMPGDTGDAMLMLLEIHFYRMNICI